MRHHKILRISLYKFRRSLAQHRNYLNSYNNIIQISLVNPNLAHYQHLNNTLVPKIDKAPFITFDYF